MKLPKPIPVRELAEMIGADLFGNLEILASGINEIHHVETGDITFVDVEKYYKKSLASDASVIIIDQPAKVPAGKALLVHPRPFEAYNELVMKYRPFEPLTRAISDSAEIAPSTILEPGVVIGHHVRIGEHCYIQANVVIRDYVQIGDHVTIQSGSIIGSDAFYFKKTPEGFQKWRTAGRVVIEDHVDIGSGCTINSGVSADTVIGEGSKLDCHIQIGHEVKVGKRCLFAAQVGIAGNTRVGDEVTIYGQVGIAQNLVIGDKAVIYAKSGVSKSLEGGKAYWGAPIDEARTKYKEVAAVRHLPEFFKNYYQ